VTIEEAFREGFNEGLDREDVPFDEREMQADRAWADSKARAESEPRTTWDANPGEDEPKYWGPPNEPYNPAYDDR
jgi:hypothetical protein